MTLELVVDNRDAFSIAMAREVAAMPDWKLLILMAAGEMLLDGVDERIVKRWCQTAMRDVRHTLVTKDS